MTHVASRRAPVPASASPSSPTTAPSVTIEADGDSVTLQIRDCLDAAAAAKLVAATREAVAGSAERISIDLRELRAWTEDGARALVECRELCAEVPAGLHYRTGRGPGRDALLAAYS
ncbi:MAG: hypothetical protein AB7L84_07775 [Acidimicrobiia bacterium]